MKKNLIRFAPLLAFALFVCNLAHSEVVVEKVDNTTVFLKDLSGEHGQSKVPSKIEVPIFGVQYLGTLYSKEKKTPFLLLSGYSCKECEGQKEKQFLYLVKAAARSGTPTKFIYPGTIRDRKTNQVVYKGRGFFGDCIAGKGDVFIALNQEKVDRRRFLQDGFFQIEAMDDYLSEIPESKRKPRLNEILKRKNCHEIAGIERKSIDFTITTKGK